MYYNKILRVWVVDTLDYFLLSAILGSILASGLKNYLSEKKAMKRLKNFIIKKLEFVLQSDGLISNFKETRIKKIYIFALENRGGQFENFQVDHEFSNEVFQLAQGIKGLVERLACFLKERELKGITGIFFKNGRLLLEFILYRCKIDLTYSLLTEGLSTQVIVITATAGGATGFIHSWFSAGASLIAPPVLISILLTRSVTQQVVNQIDYSKFKKLVNKMLEDDELKQTIRTFLFEGEVPTTSGIEMTSWDSDKNTLPEFNFNSDQTFEELIQARAKEELGLVENSTLEQLEKIIHTRKIRKRPKLKTVYFKNFINQIIEDPDNIIDAEIVKKAIKVKVKNEEL